MGARTRQVGVVLLVATGALALLARAARQESAQDVERVLPAGRSPALEVVFARPFTVDEPFAHAWRREQPEVRAGYVLVVDVDPAFTVPRQNLEPVLYVGAETAERVNHGSPSGRVVAIVPSEMGEDGGPTLDLEATPIWFGPPELPERITAAAAARELEQARLAGVRSLPRATWDAAREKGGPVARFRDRTQLERYAAERILEFVPSEAERAESMLAPLVQPR